MEVQLKRLLIVILICFLTAGTTLMLYFIDPKFETTVYAVSSLIVSSIWAFFFLPALLFAIGWAKNYFERFSFVQGFRIGYLLGYGWGVFGVLLFLIAAPVIGTLWLIRTAKSARVSLKNKRLSQSDRDVFDL